MIKPKDTFGWLTIEGQETSTYLQFGKDGNVQLDFHTTADLPERLDTMIGEFPGIGIATFCNGYRKTWSLGQSVNQCTYLFQYIIGNKHFSNLSSIAFDYCALNIDSAIDWFRIPLIEKINKNRFKIDLKPPLEIPLHISGCKNSCLRFDLDENFSFSRFEANKRAHIRLEFEQPNGFKDMLTIRTRLQKLFSFLSNKNETFKIDALGILSEIDQDPRSICPVFDEPGKPHHKLMLYLKVDYNKISDRLPEIVNAWLGDERLISIVNRSTSRYNHKAIDPEDGFLNVCAALEALHKHIIYSERKHKLEVRLRALNKICPKRLLLTEYYIQKTKRTRNYHTHMNKDGEDLFSDLFKEANTLDNFLRAVILKKYLEVDLDVI